MIDIEKYNAIIVARKIVACDKLSLEEKAEALDELKWEVRNNTDFKTSTTWWLSPTKSIFIWESSRRGDSYWRRLDNLIS